MDLCLINCYSKLTKILIDNIPNQLKILCVKHKKRDNLKKLVY